MQHKSTSRPRVYLDNAATSWPKPPAVYEAVDRYLRQVGAPAGRSGYEEATAVAQLVQKTRSELAALVGLADPSHIIFTLNGTDSLNLVLHGLLREGDHVVTTVVEHNSVLRPLAHLQAARGIAVTHVACNAEGVVDTEEVRAALTPATRLVAIIHASNVTGALQPVAQIGKLAHEAGALVLCDAAQTVGHVPVDMNAINVDFLAAPGHKGLMGPLGTGVLAIRPGLADALDSIRQGGTGSRSEQVLQPSELPDKFEAGNLNVPGIAGLAAGIAYLKAEGIPAIESRGQQLIDRLLTGLSGIDGLRVLGPAKAGDRVPLVSVALEGYDPQEVALVLDAAHRIQVRAGLHCAPLMHQALGTQAGGGTVRISLGAFTTVAEVDAVVSALAEMASVHSEATHGER